MEQLKQKKKKYNDLDENLKSEGKKKKFFSFKNERVEKMEFFNRYCPEYSGVQTLKDEDEENESCPKTGEELFAIIGDTDVAGRAISVPAELRAITGNGDCAILLSQLLYWSRNGQNGKPRNSNNKKNGHCWRAASHDQWSEELCIPPRKIRTCIQSLKKMGYVDTCRTLYDGKPVTNIRLIIGSIWKAVCSFRAEQRSRDVT